MAVLRGVYGAQVPEFVGCVLDQYEHNGRDDSDWYAIVWDDNEKRIREVEYDTTRAAGGGWAQIDATEETLRKVYNYYREIGRSMFDTTTNPAQAKKVRKGDTVKVIRGRKVPKGTVGKVFWVGSRYNCYTHEDEDRVGIEVNGEKMFLPAEYVEVIGWEDRLIRGKERKDRIHRFAVNSMPVHYQKYFDKSRWHWERTYQHEPSWHIFVNQ